MSGDASRTAADCVIRVALEERRKAWRHADKATAIVEALANDCITSLRQAGQVVFCGNGGSAAMAEHLAAELVGRYAADNRPPLSARALSCNSATMTALGNDFGFETVFARQVEGVCHAGDVLVALSTSGCSPSVVAALEVARRRGCITALLTGNHTAAGRPAVNHLVEAPATITAVVQELHLFHGHLLCELIEQAFLT